jgi:two-component system NtrC family sensor kinase
MKKECCLIFCLLLFSISHAQYKVRFILKENTSIKHDSIYVTGTFSNWDSTANKNYLLQPYGKNEKSIVINLTAGTHRYKFHRGSWFTVEKQYMAEEVPDRIVTISKDTTFKESVLGWRDEIITDKKLTLKLEQADSNRVRIMAALANVYAFYPEYYNADSAFYFAQGALLIQQKIKATVQSKLLNQTDFNIQLWSLQEVIASLLHSLGNYPKSLELRFENLKLAEKEKNDWAIIETIKKITTDYYSMKDYGNVLIYGKRIDSIAKRINKNNQAYPWANWTANNTISDAYYKLNRPDSALYYARKMKAVQLADPWPGYTLIGNLLLADIYAANGSIDSAFAYYRKTIPIASANRAIQTIANIQAGMARLFQKTGRLDSALIYARQALVFFQTNKEEVRAWGENNDSYVAEISPLLAELYKANGQLDSAYKYLRLSVTIKDSLYNTDKVRQFQTLGFNESSRRQQMEQQSREAKQQYETKIKMYGLISIITGFVVLAFVLYRNNKHKQKANTLLQTQKQEIETTLGELKTTQKQLIQSEKMASLGELTAGIAHEIQNPLNFVNNFSEVNAELIGEMKEELNKGNAEEAKSIADDIEENEQKIIFHGKRADSIVKGMLQHSRSSSGVKEPTDLNALADEYLRLAYHGLRAKDKSFNATMKTDFDESIGSINIIPQDIGRVILNLITNAFYAAPLPPEGGFKDPNYKHEPTIWVSTKKVGEKVLISVKDNGPGIPQKILDKIFQPFFTTKPTGQGTGLGLSMSYDIVTKGHAGEIKVENKEGEGAEFIIILPV